ncbi:MAG TPA: hypothetical protein VM325_19970 [Alphaproteobacteria bacterium]|nr:hypothetical protein [Alphaproteobacteria bacterium]
MAQFQAFHKVRKERDGFITKKHDQQVLDDISDLRTGLAKLRIQMESDSAGIYKDRWEREFDSLHEKIAEKIEQFASKAESNIFRTKGNLPRRVGPRLPPHQLFIDMAINDLDYLRAFISDYSRGNKKKYDRLNMTTC